MKKQVWYVLLAVAGIALMIAGVVWLRAGVENVVPYLCIGVGAGIFGYGTGAWLQYRALKDAPEARRRIEIETNDERNVAMNNRAKAKAYDAMIYIFSALLLVFALMEINFVAVLLLVAGYLAVCGIYVYYRVRYDREM